MFDATDNKLVVILPPETVITVNGIPAEITQEVAAKVHRNNIALMFPPRPPRGHTTGPISPFPFLIDLLMGMERDSTPCKKEGSPPPNPKQSITLGDLLNDFRKYAPSTPPVRADVSGPVSGSSSRASSCSSMTHPQENPAAAPDEKGADDKVPGNLQAEDWDVDVMSKRQEEFLRDRQLHAPIALALLSQPNPPCTKGLKWVRLSTPFGRFSLHHLIEQLKKNVRIKSVPGFESAAAQALVKNPVSLSVIDPTATPERNELMWRAAVWLVTGQLPHNSSSVTFVPQCFPELPCLKDTSTTTPAV